MNTRLFYWLIVFLAIQLTSVAQERQQTGNRMNVIFFLVDDLGWSDVGCYGSDFYETPNIDQLAKEGVKFEQAYASCHVCSPSRASMLTGKYPARLNLTDWLPGRKEFPFQKLKNAEINQHLPLEETTIAEALHDQGYQTAIIGKWHLGEEGSTPLDHGFDYRITSWNKGWPLTYYAPFRLGGMENVKEGYLTDYLTDKAVEYIEDNQESPFFMYLSHFAVHDPIQGRPDLVKKYEAKLAKLEKVQTPPYILEANPDTVSPFSRSELNRMLEEPAYQGFDLMPNRIVKIKQRQDNVQFAAMVESMDESLGRIVAKLKELNLYDKTIIIFTSDNGGMAAANFGNPAKHIPAEAVDKQFSTSNLPLRGAKGWLYEGGIRVPAIVKNPRVSKKGMVCETPIINTDFYPSILDMLDLPLLPEQHVDGRSFTDLLANKRRRTDTPLYWHFPHYSNHGLQSPGGAIRYGDYKLITYFENGTVQLFNLVKDMSEQHDIASEKPKKAAELQSMLAAWQKSVSAQKMVPNNAYKP